MEVRVPQIGEVTRLGGVTRLSNTIPWGLTIAVMQGRPTKYSYLYEISDLYEIPDETRRDETDKLSALSTINKPLNLLFKNGGNWSCLLDWNEGKFNSWRKNNSDET